MRPRLFLRLLCIHVHVHVAQLLLWAPATATATTEQQQPVCTDTTDSSKAYIRDSPLHQALVDDTQTALAQFTDDNDSSSSSSSSSSSYRPRYFEGWYYKLDLKQGGTFVVIPGVYLRKEEQHAFVMVLDATTTTTTTSSSNNHRRPVCYMYTFPMSQVTNEVDGDHDFVLRIGSGNVFTAHGFTLDLPPAEKNDDANGNPAVVGSATWAAPLPLPATRWNPTIMGWFSWLPRGTMQCSHGVVSMDHTIVQGEVRMHPSDGGAANVIVLTGAQGYMEKDWGREFPERYTWIQANDFVDSTSCTAGDDDDASSTSTRMIPGASFLVSVASIPVKPFERWLAFTGFLSFLRYPDADGNFQTIRFATYTGATVSYTYTVTQQPTRTAAAGSREHVVVVTLSSWTHTLTATVRGDRDGAATLWGPLPSNPSGGMHPYVREMLHCPVHVVLRERRNGKVLFDGTAHHGGFEIEGHDADANDQAVL